MQRLAAAIYTGSLTSQQAWRGKSQPEVSCLQEQSMITSRHFRLPLCRIKRTHRRVAASWRRRPPGEGKKPSISCKYRDEMLVAHWALILGYLWPILVGCIAFQLMETILQGYVWISLKGLCHSLTSHRPSYSKRRLRAKTKDTPVLPGYSSSRLISVQFLSSLRKFLTKPVV